MCNQENFSLQVSCEKQKQSPKSTNEATKHTYYEITNTQTKNKNKNKNNEI